MIQQKKFALIILDGWGHGKEDPKVNAIAKANTPFIDYLEKTYPNAELRTSGEIVGLPEGQMGNSEVGHLNIGAGRIVYQPFLKINKAFEKHEVHNNKVLLDAFQYAKKNNKKIHLLGLVSDGGVHSHINHAKGLIDIAVENHFDDIYVHAFTDGRDTDPHSGKGFIKELLQHLDKKTGKLASIIGRYYAMDRDRRWERVKKAYDLVVKGIGKKYQDALEGIEDSYNDDVTDEFIKPIVMVDSNENPVATINEGDVVIFFNFRTDRGRQLTVALSQKAFPDYDMKPLDLYYVTMTEYDDTYKNVKVIFKNEHLHETLGEVISQAGLKQLRISETEKYPHVTFFFSGGREEPFKGEERKLIHSPKVATYDLKPSMSANEVTDAVIDYIKKQQINLIILNFANSDMVGHTGVFKAIVEAVETIDKCTERVVKACQENGYQVIVTADHGNADFAVNEDGSPNTAHTKNPVPVIYINDDAKNAKVKDGKLGDLAPTILSLMGIEIPKEMDGEIIIEK